MLEESRIQGAAQEKEAAVAALYRPDGSKVFGEDEHRERMTLIEHEFAATMDRIEEKISERVAEAERDILLLENSDPADALLPSQLQRAQAKSQFVAADAERLSLDRLAGRCRAAAAGGDKANMFLWAFHAYARVGDPDVTADEPGADEVREAVAELQAKLDPDRQRKLEAARQEREDALGLREKAYFRRRGVTDAFGLYASRAYTGGNHWTNAS